MELFASIVRCKSIPGIHTRHQGLDIVLIRENTEGEYSNLEHEVSWLDGGGGEGSKREQDLDIKLIRENTED